MKDDDTAGFAAPPFDAATALSQLKRALRDMKLGERGPGFELRGKRVVELKVEAGRLLARVAHKPALTPEWDVRPIDGTIAQRKLVDEVRQRLARWEREE